MRNFAWIEDEPVGVVDSGAQPTKFSWIHADRLGTPLAVTSSPSAGNAQTVWRASYQPFGSATLNQDPDGDSQQFVIDVRFPGQIWDAESGLHYNWHRYYDPSIGRYISADPIGQDGGINVFTYAANNPSNRFDPFGLDSIYVHYDGYPVNTGYGFSLPLGHAAAISVNPETGGTRYYEFGRYEDKECGNVKRRPVPDLRMGADGLPTPGSLSALYSFISVNYGHGSPVSPTYYPDSDYSATNSFADDFTRNHSCYGLFSNNCKSFARDAATAGKE